jgi:hypothetical protein
MTRVCLRNNHSIDLLPEHQMTGIRAGEEALAPYRYSYPAATTARQLLAGLTVGPADVQSSGSTPDSICLRQMPQLTAMRSPVLRLIPEHRGNYSRSHLLGEGEGVSDGEDVHPGTSSVTGSEAVEEQEEASYGLGNDAQEHQPVDVLNSLTALLRTPAAAHAIAMSGLGVGDQAVGVDSDEDPAATVSRLPLQRWMSDHAARLLLPHQMRHMADLFTADMLWNSHHGAGGVGDTERAASLYRSAPLPHMARDYPVGGGAAAVLAARRRQQLHTGHQHHQAVAAENEHGSSQQMAFTATNVLPQPGRTMPSLPPLTIIAAPSGGSVGVAAGATSTIHAAAAASAPDALFKPPSGAGSAKRDKAAASIGALFGGVDSRHGDGQMQEILADTGFLCQLVGHLPGVALAHDAVQGILAAAQAGLPVGGGGSFALSGRGQYSPLAIIDESFTD